MFLRGYDVHAGKGSDDGLGRRVDMFLFVWIFDMMSIVLIIIAIFKLNRLMK
jgi:hypothetical protein